MRPDVKAPLSRVLLPAGLAVWSFLFVAFLGTALPAFDPAARIAAQVVYVVPLAAWATWRLRGPVDVLDGAILVGLLLTVVVSLASLDPTGSFEALGLTLAFALLFWAMREAGSLPIARAGLATGGSVAIALWLLVAASTWIGEKLAWIAAGGGIPPLDSSRIFGWSSPNTFPAMILLGLPIALGVQPAVLRRSVLLVFVACSAVVLPFSMGRAGYAGIAAAIVTYELLRGAPLLRNGGVRWALLASVLIGAAVSALLLATRGEELVRSLLGTRIPIWQQALSIFADRPVVGGGPSTFHWLRLEHAPDYGDRIGVYLAHNVVLQTLADGGLVLLLALAALVSAFAVVVRRRRERLDRWSLVALAALLGYAVALMFDDFSTFNAMTAMAVTLAAWVAQPPEAPAIARGRARLLAPAAVGVLALAALPAVIAVAGARLDAQAARSAALDSNWAASASGFADASGQHPVDGGYHLGRGLALAEAGDLVGAREAFETAMRQASGDPRPYGALAALSDDPVQRLELLELANERTLRDPQYAYRLALERLATGQPEAAASAFALAAIIEPRLFGEVPQGVSRDEFTFAVVRRVAALWDQRNVIGGTIGWDLALTEGRIATEAGSAWRAVGLVLSGDTAEALSAARDAVREQPYDPRSYEALRYVARAACDEAERARADSIIALIPHAESGANGSSLRESWDTAYREEGLGDYQPPQATRVPELELWPEALVGDPPPCD